MVRSGTIITQRLRRIRPNEHGASIVDFVDPDIRFGERQLQMLRRDTVSDGAGFIKIAHRDQGAAPGERGGNDVAARHARQQTLDGSHHLLNEGFIRTEQNSLGQLIVFGLREKIHRHPIGVGLAVTDNEDF